jgi:presenilin 1
MRLMVGYLMFSSAMLLGYSGGLLVSTALQVGGVPWDWPSLIFIMWNFAIVGVVSVFWQRGVPRVVTQGYLVCVSVVMAWILSKLPEWTVWALLVALALYDLCAVLTPCGPLKALVALAQERRDPLPGLLYEANVDEDEEGRGAGAAARPAKPPAAGDFATESPLAAAAAGAASGRPLSAPAGAEGAVAAEGAERVEEEEGEGKEGEEDEPRSIKLGLGDFVFYSVLVSRAAQFDAASLAACFVTVLLGLAGTLALLSVYRKALPALPISVLAGVLVYVLTRFSIAPCLEAMALIR